MKFIVETRGRREYVQITVPGGVSSWDAARYESSFRTGRQQKIKKTEYISNSIRNMLYFYRYRKQRKDRFMKKDWIVK